MEILIAIGIVIAAAYLLYRSAKRNKRRVCLRKLYNILPAL